MYCIIIGGGKIGYGLTEHLLDLKQEVLVIDTDIQRVENIRAQFGSVVTQGDGTDYYTLKSVGTERADIFITTTGSDATNLTACQIAKFTFNVNYISTIVIDIDNMELFQNSNINTIVASTDMFLSLLDTILPVMPSSPVISINQQQYKLLTIKVLSGYTVESSSLQEIEGMPWSDIKLVALMNPKGDIKHIASQDVIYPNDTIILLARTHIAKDVWAILTSVK